MHLFIRRKVILLLGLATVFFACSRHHFEGLVSEDNSNLLVTDSQQVFGTHQVFLKKKDFSNFEKFLLQQGLIRVRDYNKSIQVELKYATNDNFMHRNMYDDFKTAYLRKEVALKLISAQHLLEKLKPGYCLIIYDAVRPLTVQKLMWDSVDVSPYVKYKYLSNPKYHSLHNYGAAVDVSILDNKGKPLDMGTPYDCFCELAYPYFEKRFLKNGKLTRTQYQNRLLLRSVMQKNHFSGISTEWWHFNYCSRKYAQAHFPLIESFEVPKPAVLLAENQLLDTAKKTVEENFVINDTTAVLTTINEPIKHKIRFKVQIKTSTRKVCIADPIFKGLKVWRYDHQGLYKYTVGSFTDLNKALAYRNKMRTLGFADCFVAAFDNNERISIKDAFKILN